MKSTTLFVFVGLIALASCGEDVSGGRRRNGGTQERLTPGLETSKLFPSHMHRSRNVPVLTGEQHTELLKLGRGNADYRVNPAMIDDEGSQAIPMKEVRRTQTEYNECGVGEGSTLAQRIADCDLENGTFSGWNPIKNGVAGETIWKLVARKTLIDGYREIWLDARTGLLWSDIVQSELGWCASAGATLGTLCSGNVADACKATLFNLPELSWRLPTRNDYLQADVNGIRHVLRKYVDRPFWTATMDSASEEQKAWAYNFSQGTLESVHLSNPLRVRCVGISKK